MRAQSCYSWKRQTDGSMSFYDDRKKDDKLGKIADPIVRAVRWVQTRSPKEKGIMVAAAAVAVRPLCFLGPSGAAARRRRALAAHGNALGCGRCSRTRLGTAGALIAVPHPFAPRDPRVRMLLPRA